MKKIVFVLIMVFLAGCTRTAPIENIRTPINGYTEAQVKGAILEACVQRGWVVTDSEQGVIKARQETNKHAAEVRITYSATGYAINYDNSTNLMASGGEIHKRYNSWVHNLNRDIQSSLSVVNPLKH